MKIKPGMVRIDPELHFVVKTMKLYGGFEIQRWVNEAVMERVRREIGNYPEMPRRVSRLIEVEPAEHDDALARSASDEATKELS